MAQGWGICPSNGSYMWGIWTAFRTRGRGIWPLKITGDVPGGRMLMLQIDRCMLADPRPTTALSSQRSMSCPWYVRSHAIMERLQYLRKNNEKLYEVNYSCSDPLHSNPCVTLAVVTHSLPYFAEINNWTFAVSKRLWLAQIRRPNLRAGPARLIRFTVRKQPGDKMELSRNKYWYPWGEGGGRWVRVA